MEPVCDMRTVGEAIRRRWAPRRTDDNSVLDHLWDERWETDVSATVLDIILEQPDSVAVFDDVGYDKGEFVALTSRAEKLAAALNAVTHETGDTYPGALTDPCTTHRRTTPDLATLGTLNPSRQRQPEHTVAYLLAAIDAFDNTDSLDAYSALVDHVRDHLAALADNIDATF
jgi:hypothetical protein